MANNQEIFIRNAMIRNLIDERQICPMANITCSNGNAGRVWVPINKNIMYFCDVNGFAELGETLETIDLTQAKVLKASTFILNPTLKLEYKGDIYTFHGFSRAALFIDAVKQACSNR